MRKIFQWCLVVIFSVAGGASVEAFAQSNAKRSAQVKKKQQKTKGASQNKRRIHTDEKRFKTDQKNINFDDTALIGDRNRPSGSMISERKSNRSYNLIKLRLRWHPEMVQSTSSLESGR